MDDNKKDNDDNIDDKFDMLQEIESAVYEKLADLEYLLQDMPKLVPYIMMFCAKLHISMGGKEKDFISLAKEVYKHMIPHKKEIQEDFDDFLKECSENTECPECAKEQAEAEMKKNGGKLN